MDKKNDALKKILHLDGDSRARAEVEKLVTSVNPNTSFTTIANADEAKALIATQEYDLVILDTWHGRSSGYEVCAAIREEHKNIPVIFYTIIASSNGKRLAMASGADGFHTSDDPDSFVEAVAKAFAKEKG